MERDRENATLEINSAWAAPCGMCCKLCEFFDSPGTLSCGGCYGERLCRPGEDSCVFIACAYEHGVEHCGLCGEFPCEKLVENYGFCGEEMPQVAVFRIGDLALRTRLGTAEWLRRKLEGSLPDVCSRITKTGPGGQERRRYRRVRGFWPVKVSILPASIAFGLSDIEARCTNANRSGLLLILPASIREGFTALLRTGRQIEVRGEFPSANGGVPFSGRIVWHDLLQTKSNEEVRAGIDLDGSGRAGH